MTPHVRWQCAKCGQQLREGDQFCMACGTKRDAGMDSGEREGQATRDGSRQWEYARIVPREADQLRDARKWVYEAIGSQPKRGAYTLRSSPAFAVADAAFGPTLDWSGRLEGQEALSSLLADLRADGWQVLEDQEARAALPDVHTARLDAETGRRLVERENPAWSQLVLRRPTSP